MAQYHVNLAFTADTARAKSQLQDLQNQLTNLINKPQQQLGITGDIHEAIKAAAELKTHLQAATNVKTGNLDFTKLSQSIAASGKSLDSYASHLRSLGPTGQQAFMMLATSVANAEIPIRRSNKALTDMWTTLKNTARWQLSSSILHGFMGAVQSAYGYAQDLNKSLTDIRIVTGQNADEMARFAQQANKAAKELSTSTTNYTKASLIYYQQGLSDQEVKDRTDITIKMANVTRTSAQDVSDQMTAVWNNFYDGSKSLEYYADVMTALGAATASSTDEISEGLNKFAAIAETVGLSYEYAASALATVTATTRESADVVGNAFKTLFARIQGLKLGETLEDGTDLNKYSQALKSVGIDIKDVNGEIKDMDTILNEMGAKWVTLGKDQQIALAQTVAGVRQYSQLMALMDNWDYFQENLGVANNSTGTLQEQADIYADSWEAASKRVEAAAQGIYDNLINDEGFINILNSLEKILSFVDMLIDSLGGLSGVLSTVGVILTKVFADQMSRGLTDLAYNVRMMTKSGQESIRNEKTRFIDRAVNSIPGSTDFTTEVEKAQMNNMRDQLQLQQMLIDQSEKMSQIELATNQTLMDRTRILQENYESDARAFMAADNNVADRVTSMKTRLAGVADGDADIYNYYSSEISNRTNSLQTTSRISNDVNDIGANAISALGQEGANVSTIIAEVKSQIDALGVEAPDDIKKLLEEFSKTDLTADNLKESVQDLIAKINALKAIDVEELGQIIGDPKEAEEFSEAIDDQVKKRKKLTKSEKDANKSRKETEKSIKSAVGAQKTWADTMVQGANVALSAASAINMIGGAIDTLKNPDIGGWQKFATVLMTIGTLIPTAINGFNGLQSIMSSTLTMITTSSAQSIAAMTAEDAARKYKITTQQAEALITRANIAAKYWIIHAIYAHEIAVSLFPLNCLSGFSPDVRNGHAATPHSRSISRLIPQKSVPENGIPEKMLSP